MKRICVQWPRFGPYHIARLRSAGAFLSQHGYKLVGLETAGSDQTNYWRVREGSDGFERVTVFQDAVFEKLDPREIHREMLAKLDALQPDAVVIHSYSFPDSRACLYWCRKNRRVAIVGTDSQFHDVQRRQWREALKSVVVSGFDAAIVAGKPQMDYLVRLGFDKNHIFTGYDVVDNDYFQDAADVVRQGDAGSPIVPARPFFLSVNRMLEIKNLDALLKAYNNYRTRVMSPWDLVLVGDGPVRSSLERLVETERIEGVHFAGFQEVETLPEFYGRASAFVHPSLLDTWGLVVNEAMASRLPVLVSERCGCASDLVFDGENGYTFDPTDLEVMTSLLVRLSDGTDLEAFGRRSAEIISHWNLDRYSRCVLDAYSAGKNKSGRSFPIQLRIILWAIRRLSRSVRSFHAIQVD
jgi:1,2-diacylglycerol 3-alpha-glucosyltransferase